MQTILEYIVERISSENPLHCKKIKKNIKKFDELYFERANLFLKKYELLLLSENKSIDYAIDCYLQMLADVNFESVRFQETGEYSSKSFEDVNMRVYNNPEVMEYYMHGLLMSQFLWKHHYDILLWFNQIISKNRDIVNNYLEVGGGHGLYISEATEIIGNHANYDLVDISKSSLDIAKKMISNENVNAILTDVFEFFPTKKYDFITMGEVLEHVEEPVKLLQKLQSLLSENGKLTITTPTNAPAIDHIYLFKNADEIRKVISDAGFDIEEEFCVYSEDVSPEIAERLNISMMYAAVLVKKKVVDRLLEFHHVGLLVEDLDFSILQYVELFGKEYVSDIYQVESQKVKVCFVKNGVNSYIELVQPTSEDSVVSKLLKKRSSYYHIGYMVDDIATTISKLELLNYKSMEVFYSEAFNGNKCVFLFSPEAHLFELIER